MVETKKIGTRWAIERTMPRPPAMTGLSLRSRAVVAGASLIFRGCKLTMILLRLRLLGRNNGGAALPGGRERLI